MPSNIVGAKLDVGVKVAFQPRYHDRFNTEQDFFMAADSDGLQCAPVRACALVLA